MLEMTTDTVYDDLIALKVTADFEPKIREGADDSERAAAARALTIGLAALEGQEIKDL